jgi:hypothetical protein
VLQRHKESVASASKFIFAPIAVLGALMGHASVMLDSSSDNGAEERLWQQHPTYCEKMYTVQYSSVNLAATLLDFDFVDGDNDLKVPPAPNPSIPEDGGRTPVQPRTPSEPPADAPSSTSPFPADPVPPSPDSLPHFLVSRSPWPYTF